MKTKKKFRKFQWKKKKKKKKKKKCMNKKIYDEKKNV